MNNYDGIVDAILAAYPDTLAYSNRGSDQSNLLIMQNKRMIRCLI